MLDSLPGYRGGGELVVYSGFGGTGSGLGGMGWGSGVISPGKASGFVIGAGFMTGWYSLQCSQYAILGVRATLRPTVLPGRPLVDL